MRGVGERGSVTPAVIILVAGLLSVAGLVYDGGMALAARSKAIGESEAASRAGAQALSQSTLRGDGVVLDPAAAERVAHAYLVAAGHDGNVTVNGDVVKTSVSYSQPTQFLGLVGIRALHVRANGSSEAVRGVAVQDGS